MNLDDLKAQLLELWANFKDQLNESAIWNNFRERYETLSQAGQFGLRLAGWSFMVFLLLWGPTQCMSTSSEYIQDFSENRDLIRELLSTQAQPLQQANLLGTPTPMLRSQVQKTVEKFGLAAEQIIGISDFDPKSLGKSLAPKSKYLIQDGIEVKVKQLNLTQVKDLGFDLQALNSNLKMTGLEVKPNPEDDHYFDVTYLLTNYRLDLPTEEKPRGKDKGRK